MARCQSVPLPAVLLSRHCLYSTPRLPDALDTPHFLKEMKSVTIPGVTEPSSLKSLLQ